MNLEPVATVCDEQLEELTENAKDFAFARGMVMKARKDLPLSHSVTFVPFALLPSPFPKKQFDSVYNLQKDINAVYYRVTNDYAFLKSCLKQTIEADEWTRKLWHMYEKTRDGQKDVPSLAIVRSDYLLGQDGFAKQVEVNTISASFGGVSPITRELQKFVLGKLRRKAHTPENNAANISRALANAWRTYVTMHNTPDAVICFAVEDVVYNAFDQRQLEHYLVEKFDVPPHQIVRRSNSDLVSARATKNGALFVSDQEVAVFYLRTWYDAWQMPTEEIWQARETIEHSRSIKCPNLSWHLAGSKKIQQELARPGVLERFCDDDAQALRIRKAFVGLYALEEEAVYKMVTNAPEKYVLKPQREGGGYNVYTNDIPDFLKTLPEHQRKEYIVMDLIEAVFSKNYLVNGEKISFTNVVNELGIFGCVLASTEKVFFNEMDCGWIFRTKDQNSKEGGVVCGFGHLDSPHLV